MEIVERVLQKRFQELVKTNSMQFGFMPGRATTEALFVVQRMQEEYKDKKKKLYIVLWVLKRHLIEFQERL